MVLFDTESVHQEEDYADDEEEEEDVDFNPFLKEASEASSGLSSDDEDAAKKRKSASPITDEWCLSKGIEITPLDNNINNNNITDIDDEEEDAICKRTRAKYSLANFSLDELETFLQETDDDEDLPNVDDEQEYRKFLAAVLLGGEHEGQLVNENVDDEDEDSDADFELEVEELLDSDVDECLEKKKRGRGVGLRRKTRQKNHNTKFLGQGNRPLRPLVPLVTNAIVPSFGHRFLHCTPKGKAGLVNGFTPHQIGQLHCLIHEHTQLLIQIFSLCVLDPSRQQIARETRQLISELVCKRDNVLSWRKVSYPGFCFRPPYIHPSVSDGIQENQPLPLPIDASSNRVQKEVLNLMPVSHSASPSGERCNDGGYVDSLRTTKDSFWLPRVHGPVRSILDAAPISLVRSFMDDVSTAAHEYQKRYIGAFYDSQFEKTPLFPFSNIPTSPGANSEALRGTTSQGPSTGSSSLDVHQPPKKTLAGSIVESTKKQSIAFAPTEIVTLAQRFHPLFNSALYPRKPPPAAVVNRVLFNDTEDELLAMGLMEYNTDWKAIKQRFLPCKSEHQIFVRQKNRVSSKAPENPIKAVRRMKTSPLTAEEKALIFKGLKVFRNDWTSVWKFMVPHRDPSLLPRQWRTALGTQKSYKTDEAKRQKRRLYETQKRLRKSAASTNWPSASEKEDDPNNNADEGNKSENDNMEDGDEAYVHEAFLSDWKPANSRYASSELTLATLDRRDLQPATLLPQEDSSASVLPAGDSSGGLRQQNHEFLSLSSPRHLQHVSHFTHVRYSASYSVASDHFNHDCLSKSPKSHVSLRPRRVPRRKDPRLVKLAPELPPVNLPSSVRVISQSAFKSYNCVTSHSTKISCSAETENLVPRLAHVAKSGTETCLNSADKGSTSSSQVHSDKFATEDNSADTDLRLHPLLLQAPKDGCLPYYPVNSGTSASNTFNFISENQLQANFSHFGKSSDAGSTVDGFYTSLSSKNPSNSCAIDFHPLLQRKDDGDFCQLRISSDSVMSEPHVTSVPEATAPMLASPNETANELDLEIHLSSTSRKEKVSTDRKVTEHNYNGSINGLLNVGIIKETNKGNNSSQERSENFPTASTEGRHSNQGYVLGDHRRVLSDNISRCTEDYVGGQSLPEIVMEQEELSDSEEENGEDVEFECEEMDDSDREELDCE